MVLGAAPALIFPLPLVFHFSLGFLPQSFPDRSKHRWSSSAAPRSSCSSARLVRCLVETQRSAEHTLPATVIIYCEFIRGRRHAGNELPRRGEATNCNSFGSRGFAGDASAMSSPSDSAADATGAPRAAPCSGSLPSQGCCSPRQEREAEARGKGQNLRGCCRHQRIVP